MRNKTKLGRLAEGTVYLFIVVTLAAMGYDTLHKPKETIPVFNEQPNSIPPTYEAFRMTSYYTGDATGSGTCTASGICTNKFKINNKGWYTYQGMVVLAAAKKDFSRYDILTVIIDGEYYLGIVLDLCGACAHDTRIDLFVTDETTVTDRGYRGINPVYLRKVGMYE